MSQSCWVPRQTFMLERVIECGALGGLQVGDPETEIVPTLGSPESAPCRLSRRSKIWSYVYGNVALFTSFGRIDGISIEFEGRRTQMVEFGALEGWDIAAWKDLATERAWEVRTVCDVVQMLGDNVAVYLHPSGALHIVSLRTRSCSPPTPSDGKQ